MHVSNIDNWMEEIPGYIGAVYSLRCQYLSIYGRSYTSEDLRTELSIEDLQTLVTTLHNYEISDIYNHPERYALNKLIF